MTLDDYRKIMLDQIEEEGRSIVTILPCENTPSKAYTVGNTAMQNTPEILVYGLPLEYTGHILNHISEQMKKGKVYIPGVAYNDVVGGFPAMFKEVKDRDFLNAANYYYEEKMGGMEYGVLQLIYPDENNKWPWETDSQEFKMTVNYFGESAPR